MRPRSPALAGLLLFAGLVLNVPAAAQGDAKRGAYLAKAGGCVGCHTEERNGATPFAGGRALKTPFGTFYGPNITPHATAGIGAWKEHDFIRAMREGRRPDGAHYFPAFPYPSFTRIVDADLKDLFAFLRSLPPSSQASREHELPFPFGYRFLLWGWKWLFFSPGPFAPDPSRDARLNRGAYLVDALGHCGE
ncbi:MAG: c-type cytochrome [Betaproteobacteria bacterium]|nr:c-type cytochrome [Betaproteobacteria bacterium]